MAEPPYNASSGQTFVVLEGTITTPDVTDPRIVVLYFEGFDGTGNYPVMKFIDDVGNVSIIPVIANGTGDYVIPYFKDGVFYEFPFATDSGLVDLLLGKGNLIFGNADDAIFDKGIVMWNGVDGGTVEVFAESNNDGTQHRVELASADPTAEYQAVVATSLAPNHWAYVTADVCLAKAVSVDLNSTTKQTLFTVPTGRSCIITKVVQRDASATVTTAVGACGFNAGGDDVISSYNVFDKLTGTTVYDIQRPKVAAVKGSSTNTFGYKGSVAEGAARTMVVDVFGYLL